LSYRGRFEYGVDRGEVEDFVGRNECVADYLGKFDRVFYGGTWWEYARILCMFFKWLRVREGLSFSPKELVQEHVRRRGSADLGDRRWAGCLVLRFSRDNPDFTGHSDGYKYALLMAVKGFFDYHEAPLTSRSSMYGKRKRRKYAPRQISVDDARKVLGLLSQRERTICLMMLQSGQSINGILAHVNYQLDYLSQRVREGATRIRLDFPERKGNGFPYFSFISVDAIHELEKWLETREQILKRLGKTSKAIFITNRGRAFGVHYFGVEFARQLRAAKYRRGAFQVTSHMLRKLFKTESSPPERNIDQNYVEFMMGHSSGIAAVGGIYDRTPEINPRIVESEYAKLEPYINIYSSRAQTTSLTEDQQLVFGKLAQILDNHPGKAAKFEQFLLDL
jgi:hypothetical protein